MLEGDLQYGCEQLDVALRQDSEYWAIYLLRAGVMQALGMHEEALEMARQAFARNPQSLFVAAALPQYLMYAGDLAQARSCAQDMVQRFPNVDAVQEVMSILLSEQGLLEPALTHAQRAADLGAQSPLLHCQLAYVLARLKRVDEAQRALAFMGGAGRPVPYTALAVVHWALGDRAQTLQHLRDAKVYGVPQFYSMRSDPRLGGLAQDSEFQALWA
jgi:tetratricopeptide (TPR) repeat protein